MRAIRAALLTTSILALAACSPQDDTPAVPGAPAAPTPPLNADLSNNHFGTVTGIPCGGTRTVKYTEQKRVAVVTKKVCDGGSVKIEVTPQGGRTAEKVEYDRNQEGNMRRLPAKANDVTVVDVPANGKLKITCEQGTAGDCEVELREARTRLNANSRYTMASQTPSCDVSSESEVRNFSARPYLVKIEFTSVCGRGPVRNRPAPTVRPIAMGTAAGPSPLPALPSSSAIFNGRRWEVNATVMSGFKLGDIKCGPAPGQCKFKVTPR